MTAFYPISFEDIFAQDQTLKEKLDRIVERVEPNELTKATEFTLETDANQSKFIASEANVIRLLAPAGSGKTQSLVNRVISRVTTGQAIDSFLLLTFDNAASCSLRDKMKQGLESSRFKARFAETILTLNGFGYQLLNGILRSTVGPCRLADNPEKARHELIHTALAQLESEKPEVHRLLPRKLSRRVYLDLISTLKNNIVLDDKLFEKDPATMKQFLDLAAKTNFLQPWFAFHRGKSSFQQAKTLIPSVLAYIYRLYCVINLRRSEIDFDDQKLLTYRTLHADAMLASEAMNQFSTVIVDEFQDINQLDFELIRLLARNKQLIVVGDDDQAIYSFRGCSPDYILNFPNLIGRKVETHILRTNYRSPQNVVEMGNRLIAHNSNRIDKQQVASRSDRADVKLWHCLNSASEAQVIARFIKKLCSEMSSHSIRYSDVAVLLRINSQSLPLQIAFLLEDIPYHCRRDENVIVSDLMKKLVGLIGLHLQLQNEPRQTSFKDSKMICDCLSNFVTHEEIRQFHQSAQDSGGYLGLAKNLNTQSLPNSLRKANLRSSMEHLVNAKTPHELVTSITTHFANLGGVSGSLEDAIKGQLPLGEFVDIASRFRGDVPQFHEMLVGLHQKAESGLYQQKEGNAVNLVTYFRAKGRQWNTVIIPGANQRIIPLGNANVEDERRLFYVAVTRATSNLILSYVRHAVRSKVEASQYLEEMGLHDAEEKRAKHL